MQLEQAGTSEKNRSWLFLFFTFLPPSFFIFYFLPFKLPLQLWRRYSPLVPTRPLLIMGKQQLYSYYTMNEKEKTGKWFLVVIGCLWVLIKQRKSFWLQCFPDRHKYTINWLVIDFYFIFRKSFKIVEIFIIWHSQVWTMSLPWSSPTSNSNYLIIWSWFKLRPIISKL